MGVWRRMGVGMVVCCTMGCAIGMGDGGPLGTLSTDPTAVSTQVLSPGTEGVACGWGTPWTERDTLATRAVRNALGTVPEATMLERARVRVTGINAGIVRWRCFRVVGDATRPIREIRLPLVGSSMEHDGDH